jgi:hypothetical protein
MELSYSSHYCFRWNEQVDTNIQLVLADPNNTMKKIAINFLAQHNSSIFLLSQMINHVKTL